MIKEMLDFIGPYRATSIKSISGREGSGWQAKILYNGVELGEAADYGDGGSANIRCSQQEYETLQSYAKSKKVSEFEPAETFLYYLVNYEREMKKFAKKCETTILVIMPNDKKETDENGIHSILTTFKCPDNNENREMIKKKYGEVIFINDEIKQWTPVKITKPTKPKK